MPKIQAPKGTRDFYPDDLLKRRYLERLWRDTSIRHGFEEIDGPAFEHADLYKVKSGEGILAEMFGVFSGKAAEDLDRVRQTGEAPFALRPEFTPTLARMYAARAGALPKPTKWFWMQNCFRAERPQRGRLREFGQWNCDVMGGDGRLADKEALAVMRGILDEAGLTAHDLSININSRQVTQALMREAGVPDASHAAFLGFLDGSAKRSPADNERRLHEIGVAVQVASRFGSIVQEFASAHRSGNQEWETRLAGTDIERIHDVLRDQDLQQGRPWIVLDPEIVRGLAYYTGMVFEVIAEGERAVAGGGRYDNLIELFGGPPTPAVGFGMGDAVLSLLLEDKGLMPDATRAMECLSRLPASYRPEGFVFAAGDEAQPRVRPLVAELRRGRASEAWRNRSDRKPWDADRYAACGVRPMHARHSYKATRNIGKLLQDAAAQRARFAVILENEHEATLKDLDTGSQDTTRTPIDRVPAELARRLTPA